MPHRVLRRSLKVPVSRVRNSGLELDMPWHLEPTLDKQTERGKICFKMEFSGKKEE